MGAKEYIERGEQVSEIAKILTNEESCGDCHACTFNGVCWERDAAERIYDADYRKRSVGEWVCEVKHYFDGYGDLRVYVTAHCSECKTPYRDNHNVDYEFIEHPDNLGYADWNIDVEPIKKRVLERAKTRSLHKYCHECGARMKGE